MAYDEVLAAHLAGYAGRTRRNHYDYLVHWQRWLAVDGIDLLEVRRADILRWVAAQREDGLAAATVGSKLTAVRDFYTWAELEEIIDRSPAIQIRTPRRPKRSYRPWLSRSESVRLLRAADSATPEMRAAVYLWLLSGLRPREPVNLDIEHLAHHGELPTIRVLGRKGGLADVLSVASETAQAIEAARGHRTSGPLLVQPTTGRRMTMTYARKHLARLANTAEIDRHITPYALRTTFITLSLEAGISERDVMTSAGHATTMQVAHYDRLRATVSVDRNATHRLTKWLHADTVDIEHPATVEAPL